MVKRDITDEIFNEQFSYKKNISINKKIENNVFINKSNQKEIINNVFANTLNKKDVNSEFINKSNKKEITNDIFANTLNKKDANSEFINKSNKKEITNDIFANTLNKKVVNSEFINKSDKDEKKVSNDKNKGVEIKFGKISERFDPVIVQEYGEIFINGEKYNYFYRCKERNICFYIDKRFKYDELIKQAFKDNCQIIVHYADWIWKGDGSKEEMIKVMTSTLKDIFKENTFIKKSYY